MHVGYVAQYENVYAQQVIEVEVRDERARIEVSDLSFDPGGVIDPLGNKNQVYINVKPAWLGLMREFETSLKADQVTW